MLCVLASEIWKNEFATEASAEELQERSVARHYTARRADLPRQRAAQDPCDGRLLGALARPHTAAASESGARCAPARRRARPSRPDASRRMEFDSRRKHWLVSRFEFCF